MAKKDSRNLIVFHFMHDVREALLQNKWVIEDSLIQNIIEKHKKSELTEQEIQQSVKRVIENYELGKREQQQYTGTKLDEECDPKEAKPSVRERIARLRSGPARS